MENKKDSFIFYRSFFEAINDLPEENQLIIFKAISEYALNFVEPNLTGLPKTIFTLIKPQLNANNKRYLNGKKGGKFGHLGGRPKTPRKPLENPKETPKLTPNKNVNVNVNVNKNNNNNIKKTKAKKAQEKMLEDEMKKLAMRSKKYTPFQFQVAKQLGTHIKSIKNISLKQGDIKRWANQIRLLQQNDLKPRGDLQSTKDITTVIESIIKYGSNTEFFPVVESGGALREKFLKIENFLNQGSKKPKVVKDWESYNSKNQIK